MVVHLFLNNNKALDFLPINSIKNGGITKSFCKLVTCKFLSTLTALLFWSLGKTEGELLPLLPQAVRLSKSTEAKLVLSNKDISFS